MRGIKLKGTCEHPQGAGCAAPARCGGQLPRGMSPVQPWRPNLLLLLLLLLACQPQALSAQVMDFLFEKWKLYSDQCHRNMSLLPPPNDLVCNRTFDKYSCWPDTPPNTTANISCPWYLPWYHKAPPGLQEVWAGWAVGAWASGTAMAQRFPVPDGGRGARGPGQPQGRCQALIHCPCSKLHCTRNYIHVNLFASFVLKASSVLVIDWLLKTRYSQKIGDDLSVSIWLSDGAVAGCRVAAVIMQYGVVANYCWLLVEGVYLHGLLGLASFPERSFFTLYLGIGWGAPLLFIIPWAVVKCLFENIQCWTSNTNMGVWWILRAPVFLAILINSFIFVRVVHLLITKLQARQMHYADYKFRLARSTLTLIPLLGVHEVVFAFVTDEQAQGALRSAKLFFDLFLSSFQGLLVAVLYCFLSKEVQAELLQRWRRWHEGRALQDPRRSSSPSAPARPCRGPSCEKLRLVKGGSSNGAGQDPSAETSLACGLPELAESPF
ncbi:glucagon receptor isoform X2 [Marmota monax]|uniref:glucagon receptor isoform X2 n=1 Tax=Marmota monax TaxID=9995 RepID=UPI001EAFF590|nr:glucagon receptor isoform X2 [Marmota monax]